MLSLHISTLRFTFTLQVVSSASYALDFRPTDSALGQQVLTQTGFQFVCDGCGPKVLDS